MGFDYGRTCPYCGKEVAKNARFRSLSVHAPPKGIDSDAGTIGYGGKRRCYGSAARSFYFDQRFPFDLTYPAVRARQVESMVSFVQAWPPGLGQEAFAVPGRPGQ